MASTPHGITFSDSKTLAIDPILELYQANQWSAAEKPHALLKALCNSHSLITAWDGERLIGLANAISDGYLVVYYPHFVVHPDYQRQGIGQQIMDRLMKRYHGFHQQSIISDNEAVGFYERCGFTRSPCTAMWIYDGHDH